ncbi:hypothetical protein HK099_003869 [Clydaea vesicula]|uniref:Uncharacterized protein n=1 Tax=Clydaea vesicula TaxID=447962 RepID=A0AAD5XZ05_9FUNG|nr:hypothetical protein HK099_003869 [Clydaea vesicula]
MVFQEISSDDFYSKNKEFRLWLKGEKKKHIDEISSKAAHKYFDKFVKRWNKRKLPKEFYNLEESRLEDPRELEKAVDDVESATQNFKVLSHSNSEKLKQDNSLPSTQRGVVNSKIHAHDQFELEERIEREKINKKLEDKYNRKRKETLDDEILGERPVSGSKEFFLEKKRQKAETMKGFAERDYDDVELSDKEVYGNGPSSIEEAKKAIERSKQRKLDYKEKKIEEKKNLMREKLNSYKDKEEKTMQMLRSLIKN